MTSKPSAPTISVVIPCYNGAPFLRETLESALSQSYKPIEIIVIDDGSTDESAEIASQFGSPVKVLRQRNSGESVARNRGIDVAAGEWIALLDADDRWEPRKLETQVSAIAAAEPTLVCCHTRVYRFDHSGRLADFPPRVLVGPETDTFVSLLFDWLVVPSSALIRTDAARAVPFEQDVRRGEDVLFFAELSNLGTFAEVEAPLTGYRVSSMQQTRSLRHGFESLVAKAEWFKRNPQKFSEAQATTFRDRMSAELQRCFQEAYWSRQVEVANDTRRFYRAFFGDQPALPSVMKKRVMPAWLFRLKDAADRLRGGHVTDRAV